MSQLNLFLVPVDVVLFGACSFININDYDPFTSTATYSQDFKAMNKNSSTHHKIPN